MIEIPLSKEERKSISPNLRWVPPLPPPPLPPSPQGDKGKGGRGRGEN